jgi:hypothetical protein
MPNPFADLIPAKPGMFDDIPAEKGAKSPAGLFDDIQPDISQLSDQELRQLHLQSMSDEELRGLSQQQETPGFLKSAGVGAVRGLGGPGDLREAVIGALPQALQTPARIGLHGFMPSMAMAPTSAQSQDIAERIAGTTFPEPQTPEEKITAGAIGAATNPLSYVGAGGLLPKALAALGGGAGSEAGREAAGEPGALVGGFIGGGLGGRIGAGPAVRNVRPTPEQVLEAGSEGYKSPDITSLVISSKGANNLADDVVSSLGKRNARLAPQTHAIVDELRKPINGEHHTVEDLETTRRLLGEVAGKFSDPTEQGAASQAIKTIDRYMANIPEGDVLVGNAALANQALTTARANYALGNAAKRVQDRVDIAEKQAAGANSGQNLDNKIRQKLGPILTNKKDRRGLNEEDLAAIDESVYGSRLGNTLRTIGNMAGGGGGIATPIAATVGHIFGGPVGAVAAPAIGFGVKKLGNAISKNKADAIVNNIIARSPEAQAWQAIQARNPINRPSPLGLGARQALLPVAQGGFLQRALMGL